MADKLTSEIESITLTEASFSKEPVELRPTTINFLFGNNGTGKTTIARTIHAAGSNVCFRNSRSADQYNILVFNQDFIDRNLADYQGLQGVFTLNEKNNEIQTQIDELNITKNELSTQKADLEQKIFELQKKIPEQATDFYKYCWEKTKDLRKSFSGTQKGKLTTRLFTECVMNHQPADYDYEKLQLMYNLAFSQDARKYEHFPVIPDTAVLDHLPGSEILQAIIVNSAETDLAKILKSIGSTEWAHEGHTTFAEKAGDVCPYCGQSLPSDFENIFIKSFDSKYQTDIKQLNSFLERYRSNANKLYLTFKHIPSDIMPGIDLEPYHDKLAALYGQIQQNIESIRSKIDTPSKTVYLIDTKPYILGVSSLLEGFNKLIDENNNIVDQKTSKQKECIEAVFNLCSYRLQDEITNFHSQQSSQKVSLDSWKSELSSLETSIRKIDNQIKSLQSQTVETDTAKNKINQMLKDSGMQGFQLVNSFGKDHTYEVRRDDWTVASNLSEGEKNFIAFLYFYYLVFGSLSETGDTRDKIVVIDDPISSMDSSCLFIVSALVRKMIEICRNNVDFTGSNSTQNFIKQIFVLTHNAYFHRDITHGYARYYNYVSYFLVRKSDTKSSIKLCTGPDPEIPSKEININPVKNQYAALWEELNQVTRPIPLINVMRRILEYYFMQIVGYERSRVHQAILDDARTDGRFKNEDGTDNTERYMIASSLLSYLDTSTAGLNDGFNFVEDSMDAEECRKVFAMIFEIMGQKQHYDMMIRC